MTQSLRSYLHTKTSRPVSTNGLPSHVKRGPSLARDTERKEQEMNLTKPAKLKRYPVYRKKLVLAISCKQELAAHAQAQQETPGSSATTIVDAAGKLDHYWVTRW